MTDFSKYEDEGYLGDGWWVCDRCGGDGYCEPDDPINDDVDEFGFTECPRCHGMRAYQVSGRGTGDSHD